MTEPTTASYCHAVRAGKLDPMHTLYHDTEYGFPLLEDHLLFERLVLEINQAGLSWSTILKKKDHFRVAFDGFDLPTVAAYTAEDVERLMKDAGIIRNRLKIEATIENARRILVLQQEHGSFRAWLDHHHPRSKAEWVRLFKGTFRFTGGEIVGEFLMSTGYLPGAHHPDCPVYGKVLELSPPWTAGL
ncbi:DNA-3-methyladenine glycosylase I [Deinococcus cellulosilyticus]|uniref:DNA-3-methyladenine glycosylase n=1 Tax=Deinococcus cellulosilyticus (strain DSM 18568 / NBRC 106333 / KACC 11606 / 5516J-15) TaxID=1223518 RepID=A0A511MZZ3_DEIC1|nr:DNA-3-methyladenine glycosylase I [Deinococcus cellulosilyticus]GEM45706.1 DNA-3-methyladenine glycosylase [Deinococcus cellulosilyticus NBRC 106333 = KACC 11606]